MLVNSRLVVASVLVGCSCNTNTHTHTHTHTHTQTHTHTHTRTRTHTHTRTHAHTLCFVFLLQELCSIGASLSALGLSAATTEFPTDHQEAPHSTDPQGLRSPSADHVQTEQHAQHAQHTQQRNPDSEQFLLRVVPPAWCSAYLSAVERCLIGAQQEDDSSSGTQGLCELENMCVVVCVAICLRTFCALLLKCMRGKC